jgi:hypothetical protein
MKWMRWTATVLVGVLLATGVVRGAGTQFGALRDRARRALEATGARRDAPVGNDDSGTPTLAFQGAAHVAPGATTEIDVTGTFGARTRFALAGTGFTLSNPRVAQNSFSGTVAVAPGTMPGAAVLRATNSIGTSEIPVAYVGGSWVIEGTTDNGWRARFTPTTSSRKSTLAFKGEFFEGRATSPFATRETSIVLRAQAGTPASYRMDFKRPDFSLDTDSECDPVMERANKLADQLMKAKSKAEEDRISGEIDKIQDKVDTCMEKQQANSDKTAAKIQAMTRSAEFTCETLELSVAAGGAATGTFACAGKSPSFTGTMKPAR